MASDTAMIRPKKCTVLASKRQVGNVRRRFNYAWKERKLATVFIMMSTLLMLSI